MAYPADYDALFIDPADVLTLTVISVSGNRFTISAGDTAKLNRVLIGTLFTFTHSETNNVEIIRVTGKGSNYIDAERGYEGTPVLSTGTNMRLVQEPTAGMLKALQDALIRAETYFARTGSSLPSNPTAGEIFLKSDGMVYACFENGVWTPVVTYDHGNLSGLNDANAHTIYLTPEQEQQLHAGLPGSHLTYPNSHDHSGLPGMGQPARKIVSGLAANRGTPSNIGQCYFATDTGALYFSPDGLNWTVYTSLPAGTILMFEGSCPPGWARVSDFDGRFPLGNDGGVWSDQGTGGNSTHTHTMPVLIAHTHSIPNRSVTTNVAGSHHHALPVNAGSGSQSNIEIYRGVDSGVTSSADGNHNHTVTFPSTLTQTYGSDNPYTDSASNLPPYYTLVFCKKL